MEFLDDLREQRKAGKQEPGKTSPGNKADKDEDPWEALLMGASFDEAESVAPEVGSKRAKQRRKKARGGKVAQSRRSVGKGTRRGMSGGQKLILGALILLVVLALAGMAAVFSGTLPLGQALNGDGPAVSVTSLVGLSQVVEPSTPTVAVSPTPNEVLVAPSPTPRPSPTSVPVASTVYDTQILQHPDDIELYLKRGAVYLSLGVYDAAFRDYQHVATLDENVQGPTWV